VCNRVIGERRRIILSGEQELSLERARRGRKRGKRRGNGERERHCDARCGHGILLLRPAPNFVERRGAGKGSRRKIADWAWPAPPRRSAKPRSVRRLGRLA